MSIAWRRLWLVCVLGLLGACGAPTAHTPLNPQTPALERVYQDGRLAFQAGRYEDAAAHFARVVAADPGRLNARLNWAAALSRMDKTAEAIAQCQHVLALDPMNAEAYYQWGAVLVRMGRHQEAVEKFDQALALKPLAELLPGALEQQDKLQSYLRQQRRQEDPAVKVTRPKS